MSHKPKKDITRILAKNLRAYRDAKGWSQEDLEEHSGLHRTYISGIERGVRNPTITVVAVIAETLGVRIADLLSDSAK